MRFAPLFAVLLVCGCAQMHRPATRGGEQRSLATAPVAPAAAPALADAGADSSLAAIVNDTLEHGEYAKGEAALRRYLLLHPGNRQAQAILRQLTADPKRQLGRESHAYVVRPGDSYSTLAARYLGDASLFLALARYNDSTNPSLLRVGETVRLPLPAAGVSTPSIGPVAGADESDRPAAAGTVGHAEPADAPNAVPARSPEANAKRLQEQSVALLKRGHKQQALARLDQALAIAPKLKSSGAAATSLRKTLLGDLHQQAIVLYRDQKLDQAIALWDRVLSINPAYEPALIYRARALALQRRLKQL